MMNKEIYIRESCIPKQVLDVLLKDHTTSTEDIQHNIIWATKDYESLGEGYKETDEITCDKISDNTIIIPRILKNKMQQSSRSKDMAEVFTPSWICNAQNNLIDDAWFGRKGVFNKMTSHKDGTHTWKANHEKVIFPEGKTWKDYVRENRLEITCGEAPYIVSRYDATTGDEIPIDQRIGLLDRKLRVVSENADNTADWLAGAQEAYKSIYGFEWQGDNLLLARESMLYTFRDYYIHKFGKSPIVASLKYIAYIISWNVWQMDGLKGVVPSSCKEESEPDLFGFATKKPCKGCETDGYLHHNGKYCLIRDWKSKDPVSKKIGRKIRFIDLLK
ncbi:MAG: restriction endonuclease subunit M [Bacteroidales bacterium]